MATKQLALTDSWTLVYDGAITVTQTGTQGVLIHSADAIPTGATFGHSLRGSDAQFFAIPASGSYYAKALNKTGSIVFTEH